MIIDCLASPIVNDVAVLGVGDPSATRTVYATIVTLALLGVVLVVLAVYVFRHTKPEPELLSPLEQMDTRAWRRLDPATRRRLLDEARPEGATPLGRDAQVPAVDDPSVPLVYSGTDDDSPTPDDDPDGDDPVDDDPVDDERVDDDGDDDDGDGDDDTVEVVWRKTDGMTTDDLVEHDTGDEYDTDEIERLGDLSAQGAALGPFIDPLLGPSADDETSRPS